MIRLAELGCGCVIILAHALTGRDGILLLLAAFLFGVPIQIVYERMEKRKK